MVMKTLMKTHSGMSRLERVRSEEKKERFLRKKGRKRPRGWEAEREG